MDASRPLPRSLVLLVLYRILTHPASFLQKRKRLHFLAAHMPSSLQTYFLPGFISPKTKCNQMAPVVSSSCPILHEPYAIGSYVLGSRRPKLSFVTKNGMFSALYRPISLNQSLDCDTRTTLSNIFFPLQQCPVANFGAHRK